MTSPGAPARVTSPWRGLPPLPDEASIDQADGPALGSRSVWRCGGGGGGVWWWTCGQSGGEGWLDTEKVNSAG